MSEIYKRRIIDVEKRLGFLYVPTKFRPDLPHKDGQVLVNFNGQKKKLSYNTTYNRIFGLTEWYRTNKIEVGDFLDLKIQDNLLLISSQEANKEELENKDATEIDLSGLSSRAKGNIAEDRIKEIILLHSQGLLNVYKPVIDNDGIDLIVLQSGIFHPIYLQVKSRFNVSNNDQLILTISGNTFTAHGSFFLVGVSFNPQTLELDDKILFVPSKDVEQKGIRINNGNIRIVASYKDSSQGQWAKYFINKNQLAEKLLERIALIDEILK
jgi:hypothetical protein